MAERAWKGGLVGIDSERSHIYLIYIPGLMRTVGAIDTRFNDAASRQ